MRENRSPETLAQGELVDHLLLIFDGRSTTFVGSWRSTAGTTTSAASSSATSSSRTAVIASSSAATTASTTVATRSGLRGTFLVSASCLFAFHFIGRFTWSVWRSLSRLVIALKLPLGFRARGRRRRWRSWPSPSFSISVFSALGFSSSWFSFSFLDFLL